MSGRTYRRWDKSQIRQHQFLLLGTTLLILTGLPLRFASHRGVQAAFGLLSAASLAALVHRIGAACLIISCLWHTGYLIRRWRQATLKGSMIPVWKDVQDFVGTFAWLIGKRRREPRYERYSFIEKFEYLAVLWGSVVMILSGLILWFPVVSSRLVTGIGIEVAKAVHGYEALLAALSILIWHLYHAHLRADVFPMNRVWLTGTLTEEEMRHHHPLELERLQRQEEDERARAAAPPEAADGEGKSDGGQAERGVEAAAPDAGDVAPSPDELQSADGGTAPEPAASDAADGSGDDDTDDEAEGEGR